ncbi:MAG: nicotinamide-nucleotide adenylyltransferase [Thermoplasmata archaeon]
MRGLFIGRFQPFHKGHLHVVEKIAEECDTVIIGVGSAQKEREPNNPLSGGERIEMVQAVLKEVGINYEIYPIPDIDCYPAWPHYIKSILPRFQVVYSSSDVVLDLLRDIHVDVRRVEGVNRDKWKGEEIRRRISAGEEWRSLVPEKIAEYMEEFNMSERIKPVIGADPNTEKEVAHLLRKKNMTIATAESCTGGLIAHRFTNVPGSSSYFERGLVTYSNEAKIEMLGVDKKTVEEEGAVSEEVARQMAEGIKKISGATLGLATTGIAGPGGGTEENPVGTVFIGLASPGSVHVVLYHFSGNRWDVKDQTAEKALLTVIDHLKNE